MDKITLKGVEYSHIYIRRDSKNFETSGIYFWLVSERDTYICYECKQHCGRKFYCIDYSVISSIILNKEHNFVEGGYVGESFYCFQCIKAFFENPYNGTYKIIALKDLNKYDDMNELLFALVLELG